MFKLKDDEKIKWVFRPTLEALRASSECRCREAECGTIPYRILVIESPVGERRVALCGLHFIEALKAYPGMHTS